MQKRTDTAKLAKALTSCVMITLVLLNPLDSLQAQSSSTPALNNQLLRSPVRRLPALGITEPERSATDDINPPRDNSANASSTDRCLSVDLIKKTTVVDDQTIHVELQGKRFFAIRFRDVCAGLKFDQSFYYHLAPNRQLCARLDTIITRSGSRCLINKINRRAADEPSDK
jgi:Family of unknown function (DUF6491)